MLDLILLIDDSEADNYFHEMIIREANCTKNIVAVTNGEAALKFLSTPIDGSYPKPDLIFLDINMPRMNGWEFIDAYDKLPADQRGNNLVVMLTTSLNPDDDQRAKENPHIESFINKPLTQIILEQLVDRCLEKA